MTKYRLLHIPTLARYFRNNLSEAEFEDYVQCGGIVLLKHRTLFHFNTKYSNHISVRREEFMWIEENV